MQNELKIDMHFFIYGYKIFVCNNLNLFCKTWELHKLHTLSDVASSIVMSDTAIKEHKMTFFKIAENHYSSM